jgi:hypothetical protein
VKFPFAARFWAPPDLLDQYPSAEGTRKWLPRPPGRLMCRILRLPRPRFPGPTLVFARRAGYGTHEGTRFAYRHCARPTPGSKLHRTPTCIPPRRPPHTGKSRPWIEEDRPTQPDQAAVAALALTLLEVDWYGGGTQRVSVLGRGRAFVQGRGQPAPPPPGIRSGHERDPRDEERSFHNRFRSLRGKDLLFRRLG